MKGKGIQPKKKKMKGKGTNCICIQFFRNFHVANYDKNCIKCYNTSTIQQKK